MANAIAGGQPNGGVPVNRPSPAMN
jgi:hypothetical protein